MFSGIVEISVPVISAQLMPKEDVLRISVERPEHFNDLELGHSICTNGVCLTVEKFDQNHIQFALGKETLEITGWTLDQLKGKHLNLERSLRYGDRIHGHFVTGHVDASGRVLDIQGSGDYLAVTIEFPKSLKPMFWKKGSVTINGVGLTVNDVQENSLKVGLIPETLRLTNLKSLKINDPVNIEVDYMARAFNNYFSERFPDETPLR